MKIFNDIYKVLKWALLIIVLFILMVLFYNKATAQSFSITERWNACNSIEAVNIVGSYPADVHSLSWEIFVPPDWELGAICRSDVFIDGYYLDSIYSDRCVISWFSLNPLAQTNILFRLIFIRKSWGGMLHDVVWTSDIGKLEITDYNNVVIPAVYSDGFLRCDLRNVKEKKDLEALSGYNILGQKIR